MKNTIITVLGYPDTFSFITRKELPDFEYGCEVRRSILVKKMKELGVDSPCHGYDEYVVELVEKKYGQEYWQLGS